MTDESSDGLEFSDEMPLINDEAVTPLIKSTMKSERKPPIPNKNSNLRISPLRKAQKSQVHPTDITDIIGESGWWQIKILILTSFTGILAAWNHLGMTFLAYPVDHWCSRMYGLNISLESWQRDFLPNSTVRGQPHASQCEMYAFNATTQSPVTSRTINCESFEYSTEFKSIIQEWELVCNKEWMISGCQTVYMMGFLITVMVSGQFADMYGRHHATMACFVIIIVAGVSAAFSTTLIAFSICRFFVAIGHGGITLVTFTILLEAVGSDSRVLYMFLQGIGWHIGFMSLPLIAWLEPDWFKLQLIITLPSIFYIFYFWFLPESPRWLLASGKVEKAIPILASAAKLNGKVVPDLEEQAKIIANLNYEVKEKKSKVTFIDLLRTPNLRMKTLCLYFIWAVIAFTYYGLSLNTNDLQGNQFLNFFLSGLMEIPSTIFCMLTLNRFGRKKPFFLSLLFGGLSCIGCIFIPERLSGVKTSLAMIGKAFNTASFSIVYILSAEIFPTVARNIGVGSSSTVARIGSSIAPFMKDLGNITSPSVPLVIFGVLSVLSAFISLKLPETNNEPIPESIEQAEQFGKKLENKDLNIYYKSGSS